MITTWVYDYKKSLLINFMQTYDIGGSIENSATCSENKSKEGRKEKKWVNYSTNEKFISLVQYIKWNN